MRHVATRKDMPGLWRCQNRRTPIVAGRVKNGFASRWTAPAGGFTARPCGAPPGAPSRIAIPLPRNRLLPPQSSQRIHANRHAGRLTSKCQDADNPSESSLVSSADITLECHRDAVAQVDFQSRKQFKKGC
jgi:hypothetical protein